MESSLDVLHVSAEDPICHLLQKCDLERTGLVEVGSLVEYIRKMQLGQESSGEEVYDSDEDVSL